MFDTNTGANGKRSLSARLSASGTTSPPPKINFGGADRALKDALGLEKSGGDISIKGASSRGNVVRVTGLVKGTTAADVEAIFKRCGHIISSSLETPTGPQSDPSVRLTYKNSADAQAAIKKFDGQQADGKTLRVTVLGGVNATLGGRLGLSVVDGSVDVLMDSSDSAGGSKMRSDSILASDPRAQVLIAPPGTDPKEYAPQSSWRGGRGGGRGRGGRRRGGGGARMDLD
ncbi:hypothetical protein JAAARDRAFT_60096 [Jaapia argillacea MUCL 33604]|uniref:RRM domain-containing protein n=1 Tax=Jaapia argillacea MUCL 33604 TaxID=933084 RepID=A0A067PMV5_9AGAM|nr:hypothetical protein JAAARDRAFT_60096 [Jaapia argillacea MUCL 33604]